MIQQIKFRNETHEHILEASGLEKDQRSYNALLHMLQMGAIMDERLGKEDTIKLKNVLDKIGLGVRFFDGGLELIENSTFEYYWKNIHVQTVYIPVNPDAGYSGKKLKGDDSGWIRTNNREND